VWNLSAFIIFDIKTNYVWGAGLRGNMVFHIILNPAWHLSKNRCTCCTWSWNFAMITTFDLLVQKTPCACDRLVKTSTRSWTRVYSSDKFRAITGKDGEGKFGSQENALSKA
jgi:hypothetical protein